MITCQACKPQLLPYLFDLVEDAERKGIIDHLSACSACRAAFDQAREHQEILAVAAKTGFPNVRFEPASRAGDKKTITPPRPRRVAAWGRYAVAACFMLLLGGAGWTGFTWYRLNSAASQAEVELAQAMTGQQDRIERQLADFKAAQLEITKIADQITAVEKQYRDELSAVKREFDSQPVQFTVNHPRTLQAGGANHITIEAKRKPEAAKGKQLQMVALVVDSKTKAEIARRPLLEGQNDVLLPANLPLVPGTQLNLRVLATETGKADQILIDEILPLVTSIFGTHLTTDRPLYRPGEVVYFRSLTLERFSLKPADEDFELHFRLVKTVGGQEQNVEVFDAETGKPAHMFGASRLQGKDGIPLLSPDGRAIKGIGAGSFRLNPELAGGEYSLIVSDIYNRFPPEKRKFLVNRYQAPRLYKDVDFTRKSYGPGDTVTATCKVSPVEGGKVLAKLPVTVIAEVDGFACEVLTPRPLATDERGQCIVQFRLPNKIQRGEGILSVTFTDGANVETTVEPIPIVLNKLQIDFYPEGGELVAGVVNRVYFQAKTLLGKPAEVRGRIVDEAGNEAAVLRTFSDDKEIGVNQGMGRFDFEPKSGQRYELKIETPEKIEGQYKLPPVQESGVVLHLLQGVVTNKIDLVLTSPDKARKLLVGAYCRGQLLDHQIVDVAAGKPMPLSLKPVAEVGGVYRVTVFEMIDGDDKALRPIAERLLYRRSPDKLHLEVFTDKKSYTPGERVTLSLRATDQHNQPAPAIVLLSVVDKSILKLRNDRTARAMPTHFLLTSEVRGPEDLEYADVLLLEKSKDGLGLDVAKAQVALDLLLGTQGWRRFIEQTLPFQQQRNLPQAVKDDTDRLLALSGQGTQVQMTEAMVTNKSAALFKAMAGKHEQLERELGAKELLQEESLLAAQKAKEELAVETSRSQTVARIAALRLAEFRDGLKEYGELLILVSSLTLIILAACLIVALAEPSRRLFKIYFATAGLCFSFTALIVGIVMWANGSPDLSELGNLDFVSIEWDMEGAGEKKMSGSGAGKVAKHEVRVKKQGREIVGGADGFGGGGFAGGGFGGGGFAGAGGGGKGGGGGGFGGPIFFGAVGNPDKITKRDAIDMTKFGSRIIVGGANPGNDKVQGRQFQIPQDFVPDKGKVARANIGNLTGLAFIPAEKNQGGEGPLSETDRQLRKAAKFEEVTQIQLAYQALQLGQGIAPKMFKALTAAEAFTVREYSHRHQTNAENIRSDFTETLLWHPALVLPGETTVRFELSDAVTQFQVQVWGHTQGGQLGAVTKDIASRLPFSVDAKLPIEISNTDKIAIAVALTNDTEKNRDIKLSAEAVNLSLLGDADHVLNLKPFARIRKVLEFQPNVVQGEAKVRLFGLSEPFGMDSIERTFKIVSEGFPVNGKFSGMLKGKAEHLVQLPAQRDQWVPGTLRLNVQAFPSTLADLQKGLEALLREPGGCFEQTSSSNYPNVMILDYLKESDQVQPAIEKRARALLENGYGKLVAFECIDPATGTKKQGYEWFGRTAPPHEALTAYGLLQFIDMAKYQPVDQAMLERTKNYLLQQRDGKGGFLRNDRALDQFGRAPAAITDAYIVWALCEAGVKEDIRLEVDSVVANASRSEDPYLLALASLSLLKRGQIDRAAPLLQKLQAKQLKDGSFTARETSITHSGGTQLTIETTSLALLACLRAEQPEKFGENVQQAAGWIGKQRGGMGGYGSTQSTILALKALIAFTRANKHTAEAGELQFFVNGRPEPAAVTKFPAGTLETLVVELPDDKFLEPGHNTIRVEITGHNAFPHTLSWSYMALTPANNAACPVRLTTKLSAPAANEGQTLRVTAELENVSGQEQGMAVAIVGLPGGCALPADMQELRNLVKAGKIDAFEIRGRELVLYWRGLAKDAKHEVNFSVICEVPGQYRGAASRAYLYYNTDERWWVAPLAVGIAPRVE